MKLDRMMKTEWVYEKIMDQEKKLKKERMKEGGKEGRGTEQRKEIRVTRTWARSTTLECHGRCRYDTPYTDSVFHVQLFTWVRVSITLGRGFKFTTKEGNDCLCRYEKYNW
jgi:hypothetical protein